MIQMPHQSTIGAWMYASIGTWGDLCYTMSLLSCYLENLKYHHWKAVKCVFQYLKGTTNYTMKYNAIDTLTLKGCAEMDWGPDEEDQVNHWVYLLAWQCSNLYEELKATHHKWISHRSWVYCNILCGEWSDLPMYAAERIMTSTRNNFCWCW